MLRALLEKGHLTLSHAVKEMESPDPATAHDATVLAGQISKQIDRTQAIIDSDEVIIGMLQGVINHLQNDELRTEFRTLALRHIEDAQARLVRELGNSDQC